MKKLFTLLILLFIGQISVAQVGINTTTPDASAALDIESSDGGLLIPRMTTTEISEIVDPATSLLVYDTEQNGYYFNNGTPETPDWKLLLTDVDKRDNYQLVKSQSDLPEPSGGVITLDENTLYEINGQIVLTASIEINNAYVIGKDTNEDVLVNATGSAMFTGSTGGSFRNLTFTSAGSGNLFDLTGSASQNLIIQSSVIANFPEIGTVSSFGTVFFNVIQYVGNSDGITYSNIGNLLLNNMGWQDSNSGAYETFTGSFDFIEKISGFSTVSSGATGIDVSSNPDVTEGTMKVTVFTGDGTYVNPYTGAGTYPGYNFTNNWVVDCIGIPLESDDNASGNIYITRNSTTGNPSFSVAGATAIDASIEDGQMFRFSSDNTNVSATNNNILSYEGQETRTFSIRGDLSFEPVSNGNATVYAFYIRRYDENGNSIEIPLGSEVYEEVNTSASGDSLVRAIPLSGKVTLDPGDYVQIFGQTITGNRNNIRIYSVSLTLD